MTIYTYLNEVVDENFKTFYVKSWRLVHAIKIDKGVVNGEALLVFVLSSVIKQKTPAFLLRLFKAVVWAGIEPATHGFSVHCSTN